MLKDPDSGQVDESLGKAIGAMKNESAAAPKSEKSEKLPPSVEYEVTLKIRTPITGNGYKTVRTLIVPMNLDEKQITSKIDEMRKGLYDEAKAQFMAGAVREHERALASYERLKKEIEEGRESLKNDVEMQKYLKSKEKQSYCDHSDDEEDVFGAFAALRDGPGPVPVFKVPKVSVKFIHKALVASKVTRDAGDACVGDTSIYASATSDASGSVTSK